MKKFIRNTYFTLKRIRNASSAFYREISIPTSFIKGNDFEFFLRKKVFTKEKFDLLMKTHDFHINKNDYVESSMYPDYKFRGKDNKDEFWVEAKYREKLKDDKIEWCSKKQFERYREIGEKEKVKIALGFGGRPKNPKQLFIIPLEEIKYNALYLSTIKEYEIKDIKKNFKEKLKDKIYD